MKVVVTGFQPFGKEEMNPSFEAVRLLPGEISGAQIVKEEIPVVFRKGGKTVHEIVRRENPDIVILVGQAGGRTSMNVLPSTARTAQAASRTTRAMLRRAKPSTKTDRLLTLLPFRLKPWSKR